MNRLTVLISLPIVLLTAACGASEQNESAQNLEQALTEKTQNFSAIWNKADLAGYLGQYRQDDSFSLYYSGGRNLGIEAVGELYNTNWPTEEKMGKFYISDVTVNVLSPNVALTHGLFTHHFTEKTVDGNFTLVWVKEGENWMIAHEHTARIKVTEK